VQAAKLRYPELFAGVDTTTETWILDQMRVVNTQPEFFFFFFFCVLKESKFIFHGVRSLGAGAASSGDWI
jgi:hypothetical protein